MKYASTAVTVTKYRTGVINVPLINRSGGANRIRPVQAVQNVQFVQNVGGTETEHFLTI